MLDMLRYNNIFKSDEDINNLVNYLKNKELPPLKNPKHFLKRAQEFSLVKNQLVLTKTGHIVVKASDRTKIMSKLYNDTKLGAGKGIITFYKLVASKYINIRRSDCEEFLKTQAYYQLQQPLSHVTNKPIVATYPNQLYCIDLIDMNLYANHNYTNRYILTIVDAFSGKCWLGKLTEKSAAKVAKEFERVREMYPTYILCDNGTEFQGDFIKYCKGHDIIIRNTTTYAPQSNGIVENKNRQVRKLIRDIFLRTNKLTWSTYLDEIQNNLNNTYHSKKKSTPNELWTATENKIPMPPETHRNLPEQMQAPLNPQQKEVKRMLNKQGQYDDKVLEVGDYVRVKMSALYSGVRQLVKEGNEKLVIVKYTPDIYRVVKVVKPRKTQKLEYYIANEDGERPNRSFFLSDLQKVDANANDNLKMTTERALDLNNTWFINKSDNIGHN